MGKLEEFTQTSLEFAKARKGVEVLARISRRGWRRSKFPEPEMTGCFRILTDPEKELESWDTKGGYIVGESVWGRFPCTANKYLPWMMKQKILPPGLKKPEVMIEVEHDYIDCVKYSQAALGVYPIRKDRCEGAWDVYVSNEDLILSECHSLYNVPLRDIKRMWIETSNLEVKEKAEEFVKRHNISVEYKFPEPTIDDDQEDWYRKNYSSDVADRKIKEWREMLHEEREKPLLDLINYLKERHEVCWDILHPPRDIAAGALAEAYDKEMFKETPFGASDAIATMIEVGQKEPTLSPVWGLGQPKEACLSPEVVKESVVVV